MTWLRQSILIHRKSLFYSYCLNDSPFASTLSEFLDSLSHTIHESDNCKCVHKLTLSAVTRLRNVFRLRHFKRFSKFPILTVMPGGISFVGHERSYHLPITVIVSYWLQRVTLNISLPRFLLSRMYEHQVPFVTSKLCFRKALHRKLLCLSSSSFQDDVKSFFPSRSSPHLLKKSKVSLQKHSSLDERMLSFLLKNSNYSFTSFTLHGERMRAKAANFKFFNSIFAARRSGMLTRINWKSFL